MAQAWAVGSIVSLSILVLTLTVSLVLALLQQKQHECSEDHAYSNRRASPPFKEKSTLNVSGVVVRSNNCRDNGVNIVVSTFHDHVGGVWANIASGMYSQWPPKGTVKVVFVNAKAESHEFSVTVGSWGVDRSVSRRIFDDAIATVPESHGDALPDDSIFAAFAPVMAARSITLNSKDVVEAEASIPWRLVQLKKRRSSQHVARMSMFDMNPRIVVFNYDMRRMHTFMHQHFNADTLQAFCKLSCGALKRDLFRLCEIYIMGGIYADVNLTCVKSLDYLLHEVDLVVVRDSPFRDLSYIHNDFFAARALSPFLKFSIQDIVTRVLKEDISRDSLSIAGGGSVGRSLNRFAQRPESSSHVLGTSMYGTLRVRVLENDNDLWIEDSESGMKIVRARGVRSHKSVSALWGRGRAHVFFQRMHEDEYTRKTCSSRLGEYIPRVLLQTCASSSEEDFSCDEYMAAGMLNRVRKMRELHLSHGWGCYFATDNQRRMDVAAFDDARVLRAFDALDDGRARAEFWAIVYLSAHGGVYYHIQTTRLHSKCFDILLPPSALAVAGYRKAVGVTGHFWAAAARHPFFNSLLREAVDSILERDDTNSRNWFTNVTGSGEHGVVPLLITDHSDIFIDIE